MTQNQANGSAKNRPVIKRSNTTPKQPGGITGKGFVKGDPRINRKGRPRTFDEVREVAQAIANETEPNRRLAIENVLRSWKDSPEPTLQKAFVEYAFGKVPDKIESTIDDKRSLRLHWPHERQDLATSQNGSTNRSN